MDLDSLLWSHQLSSVAAERSMKPLDRLAHEQFTLDRAEPTPLTRAALFGRAR